MSTQRKRLNMNRAQLVSLGVFLQHAGGAFECGFGAQEAARARFDWTCMDKIARAAVSRLGLRPQLTALGCIAPDPDPTPVRPLTTPARGDSFAPSPTRDPRRSHVR